MASSVARMPTADVGPFGSHLKKLHTREKHFQDQNDLNTPTSRRQSQIVDRWAALQAREAITTIERRAHEAELTALSSTAHPVSARAATFMRETSPSMSECSSGVVDLTPNVRASSLIQMWREMEVEGGAPATPRREGGGGGGGQERKMARQQSVCSDKGGSLVRFRCRREMEDLMERMQKERETEVAEVAEMQRVSRFWNRGRIQSMLKLGFLRKDLAIQNHARPATGKKASERSESGVTILFLRERFDNRSQNDSGVPVMERSSTVNVQFPIDSQDSCSTHSADQFSIDNNQYQEVISIEDPESLPPESTSPQSICEDLNDGSQSVELNTLHSTTEELNETSQDHGFNLLDSISQSPELSLLHFRSEDLNDGSQSPEASWDERNLWESNHDWQSMESRNVHGWKSESKVVPEQLEPYTQQDIVNTGHAWMGDSYISWRGWGLHSQEYHDYYQTFSDNVEIRELLERRRVTTSLESEFCDKMNQIIRTFLQRQEQYVEENFCDEYGEEPTWRHSYGFNNANQVASDSSLEPSSYQAVHYPDSWQHTSFTYHSSHNLQELETVHELKNEMVQMHQEISDLRKLVVSCMEWQEKLQDSIKDEVSSAIRQSVLVAKTSEGSKRTPGQKDSCCICHEMQVDSLLYRCGHMCTCFKCAHELQQNSGTCPICQAPIFDVVRAYPNT